jgi:hypothetical protein
MDWFVAKMQGDNTRRLDKVISSQQLPVDYYRPLIPYAVRRKGKRRRTMRPVLFDYIFLQCDFTDTGMEWLTWVPITLIVFRDRIATITGEQMDALRAMVAAMDSGAKPKHEWMGRAVMIRDTAMGNLYGTVVGVNGVGLDIEVKCFSRVCVCHRINAEYVVPLHN